VDGTVVRYRWAQTAGPAVTLSQATQASAAFRAPAVAATTRLGFRLTVTDNAGASASDWVNVTVAADGARGTYAIGTPVLRDWYVSPGGNDSNSGRWRAAPLRTIAAAWGKAASFAATGHRINLLPGVYPCEPLPEDLDNCQNYLSDRRGSYEHPLILRAADGVGTVTLRGGLNIENVSYLYLIDLGMRGGPPPLPTNSSGNNLLHLTNGDHLLLRNLDLSGPAGCDAEECNNLQEILKVNQAQQVYVEGGTMAWTRQTVLDFVAVQYGHVLGTTLEGAGGRCAYLKGGSAYFRIDGNRLRHCREAGMQVGEGSNLVFLVAPWLHYEAYDVKVTNNLFEDIQGTGLTVAGGYNILFADNTLHRTGQDWGDNGYGLIGAIHGGRVCGSAEEYGGDLGTPARCRAQLTAGGWGTAVLGAGGEWIPNRSVYVYNNLFYNPAGSGTRYNQITVNGRILLPAEAENIPNPSRTDSGLKIRGNLIWNEPREFGGLVGDNNGSGNIGCRASNLSCNEAQLESDNRIGQVEPRFVNPAIGDFRPVPGSLDAAAPIPIPSFVWGDAPAGVPRGTLGNGVRLDRAGRTRGSADVPGAYLP
jgi:hypothetical protein